MENYNHKNEDHKLENAHEIEESANPPKSVIRSIFELVAVDEEFKSLLLSAPDLALEQYELSDTQLILVKSLSKEDLDRLTPDNVDEFFKSDAESQHIEYHRTVVGTIFERVIIDETFKSLLLSDPDTALSEYELSDYQVLLIKALSAEDLDKLTPENIEEFFSSDAAVYTPDDEDLLNFDIFNENEDDFDVYCLEDFEDLD